MFTVIFATDLTLDRSIQVQSVASDACLLQRVLPVCQHKPNSLVSPWITIVVLLLQPELTHFLKKT